MEQDLLDILGALRTMFKSPQLDSVAGGKPPRTSISDALSETFIDIVEVINPPVVLEVGAHDASFSCLAKARLPASEVSAFEANPHVYSVYSKTPRVRTSGIQYILSAVSDVDGEVELIIPTSVAGTRKPLHNRMGSLNQLRHPGTEEETVLVPSVTLDTFLRDRGQEASAIWIDVEGAVDRVLDGAASIMPRTQAVMCEVEDAGMWKGQVTGKDIIDRFLGWDLVPVLCDCQTRLQWNVILIKRDLLESGEIRRLIMAFPSKAAGLLRQFISQ